MHYSKTGHNTFIIRLVMGEKVMDSIKRFCKAKRIFNAYFIGLGSVEGPIMAHYRVDEKKYKERRMKGIFELTGMIGDVALFEKEPLVHAHINISDEHMRAFGGHLVEAKTSATVEIILTAMKSRKTKKYSEEIGLKLFQLSEEL